MLGPLEIRSCLELNTAEELGQVKRGVGYIENERWQRKVSIVVTPQTYCRSKDTDNLEGANNKSK